MANPKSTFNYVKAAAMPSDAVNSLSVLGGIVVGRFMSKQLDKIISSPQVSGLLGVEMAAKTAKYVKPALVAAAGIATYQIGKGKKSEAVRMIGLGIGAVGLGDIASVLMNKNVLAGALGNTDTEYRVIDSETGMPISGTTLSLPTLGYEDEYGNVIQNRELYGSDDDLDGTDDDLDGTDEDYFVN